MNITIRSHNSYTGLIVDNVIQSVYPPPDMGYWQHMIPDSIPNFNPENALLLGVGGGTICRLLQDKFPNIKITGIDNSKEIIENARKYLKFDEVKINLVIADAFDYLYKINDKYDLIIVDIWNGYWFPFQVLSIDFIRRCKELLKEHGWMYINAPNLDFLAELSTKNIYKKTVKVNTVYSFEKIEVDKKEEKEYKRQNGVSEKEPAII